MAKKQKAQWGVYFEEEDGFNWLARSNLQTKSEAIKYAKKEIKESFEDRHSMNIAKATLVKIKKEIW
jgi:hypothetical protein